MKDLILLGIQGSGKGTQADLLAQKYHFKKFETGKVLRELASQDTELGHKIKTTIDAGILVSSEQIVEILDDFLNRLAPGDACLFDGIPRNLDQYREFKRLMNQNRRTFEIVLIDISEQEAIRRLSERKVCPKCKKNYAFFYTAPACEECNVELIKRADDQNMESIMKRLQIFKNDTLPIVELLKADGGELIRISGEQSIEEVAAAIELALKEHQVV